MTTAEIQLNDPQTLYRRWEDSSGRRSRSTSLRMSASGQFALGGLTRRLDIIGVPLASLLTQVRC